MRAPRSTVVLAALALGCDIPPELPAADGPRVVASDPQAGDQGVDRAVTIRVFVDRPLLPRDVHRGTVSVRSGERSAYVAPYFDPIDGAIVIANLGEPLDPSVVWRARVEGVRDLDRHAMAEPWEAAFRTGEQADGEVPPPPPRFADVAPILSGRCAERGCHGGDAPALGLDLSSAEAARRTAIGVPAEQARTGAQGDRAWHGSSTLTGLARVDVVGGVGRPAFSYLVYKVIGDPHTIGDRMPPSDRAPLDAAELRLLSRWILAGAPTD